MITLVLGGAASGKSEYAEDLTVAHSDGNLVYLATMMAYDEESDRKIDRHREMRKDKGFATVEGPTNCKSLDIPKGSTILLDCMSNLLANEMYAPEGNNEHPVEEILAGVDHLVAQSENVVIVSNEIFSDGITYDESTEQYILNLGTINQRIGVIADIVVEIVCGIPIIHKRTEAVKP